MFSIDNTLVSEALLKEEFTCDLERCKGACCVEGEAGAPLSVAETRELKKHLPELLPFLNEKGKAVITAQGTHVSPKEGVYETPLVNGAECAYTVFDAQGKAQCGIENANKAGATKMQKPISCHLYPVRVTEYSEFTAVNYHQWNICSPACTLGAALKQPVYRFTKQALIRKFGKAWYSTLEKIATAKPD